MTLILKAQRVASTGTGNDSRGCDQKIEDESSAKAGQDTCVWCGRLHPGKASIFCSARCAKRGAWPWKFKNTRVREPWICELGRLPHGSELTALSYPSKGLSTRSHIATHTLNENWRITDDGVQWTLEHRKGEQWRGRSWCRTRCALERCIREHAGIDTELALPELHPSLNSTVTPSDVDTLAELKACGFIGEIWPVFRWDDTPKVYGLLFPRKFIVEEFGISDAELRSIIKANDIADWGEPREAKLIKAVRKPKSGAR